MKIFTGEKVKKIFLKIWGNVKYNGHMFTLNSIKRSLKEFLYLNEGRIRRKFLLNRICKKKVHPFPQIPSNSFSYLHLMEYQPKISIIVPVYNSRWMDETVESVLKQTYRNFELILVDDASTNKKTLSDINSCSAHEKTTVLKHSQNKGISAATNLGISKATGDYIAFMDHDDLLHPDALALIVRTMNSQKADIYYTDEALMNEYGRVFRHMRKCPINEELLLGCNAVLHFCVAKREAVEKIGPLKSEYDGSQDHDFVLRALENGCTFVHAPYIVYAWRIHDQSTSNDIRVDKEDAEKDYPKAYKRGKKLIGDYLKRNKINGNVTDDSFPWYRVKYQLPKKIDEVGLIVPFKDQVDYIKTLIKSLEKTNNRNFKIYLVDNRSEEQETYDYLKTLKNNKQVKILNFDEPFNYSRLHNEIVKQIPNELVLFMNNDIEIMDGDWLDAMLEHIYRPNVAAVGCKLYRPDSITIQHAGVFLRPSIFACAQNLNFKYSYYTETQHAVSCVTAACMLIRKTAFQKIGGFDEINFPIGFSDVDLCIRLLRADYKIIYTPYAELRHHESSSRKIQEESYELYNIYRQNTGGLIQNDRFYRTIV